MYNDAIKKQYIKTSDYPRAVELLFEKTEEYEIKNGKDVFDFSLKEIEEMYKNMLITSINILATRHSALKIYTNYCISKNLVLDGQNHYLELEYVDLYNYIYKSLRLQQIISRIELEQICEANLNNEYEECLLFCLFEGIRGEGYKDIIELTRYSIDEETNIVHLSSGRNIKVSRRLAQLITGSAEQTIDFKEGRDLTFYQEDIDAKYVFKRKYNAKNRPNAHTISLLLARIGAKCGDHPAITSYNLRTSGIIDYVNSNVNDYSIGVITQWMNEHLDEIERRFETHIIVSQFVKEYFGGD